MDIVQHGIITLIKSAITGKSYTLPDGFSLEGAMHEMQRHQVVPLCYDGAMRCGVSKNDPFMKKMFGEYCVALIRSEAQLAEVRRVCDVFDRRGIDYLPLRGCNMKKLYPKPEMRIMCDADILIRNEQRAEIEQAMTDLGFENVSNGDYDLIWDSSTLHLELHRRLVASYYKSLYEYLGDGWRLAKHIENNCYAMSPEDEYLYVFIHFLKHYREGGIGLRQMIDFWVFLRSYPELNISYIEGELEKVSLLEFYKNVRRTIAFWFEDAPSDDKCEFLSLVIFESGSYGLAHKTALANANRLTRQSENNLVARVKYFIYRLFPPRGELLYKFPILEQYPWMLPMIWVYRPFYKVLFEREDISKQRRFMKDMNQANLDEHRRQLEYVGLDPNF